MKNDYKGFIEPIITPDNYVLGAKQIPEVVLQEDGDWTNSLPQGEEQNKNLETYNCTSFGSLNAIEILMFKLFGKRVNYSDRFVGIMAGTKEGGNDPHTVCEAIRKYGLIPEEMLPFSSDIKNIDEYYSFKGADKEACLRAGQDWLNKYDFKHEWVFTSGLSIIDKLNNMKKALQYSPLAMGVFAWATDEEGKYKRLDRDNHWTSGYKILTAFDSYDPYSKSLRADFDFFYVKRFHIEKKPSEPLPAKNWLSGIFINLWDLIKDLWK